MRPLRRFGQHFLRDPQVARRMVQAMALAPEDCVLEIGPGRGALSEFLLAAVPTLDAVEIDAQLVALLRRRFAGSGLRVHEADALRCNLKDFLRPGQRLRVAGNLPYNISTPLLFHLLAQGEDVQDMHFMLQAEVVERLGAAPGSKSYGRLSVMVGYHCQVQPLFGVEPGAFSPPPAVQSTVVRLRVGTGGSRAQNQELFSQVVRAAFGQRRKTLGNALRGLVPVSCMEEAGVDARQRAEQLAVEDFVALSNQLARRGAPGVPQGAAAAAGEQE